MSKYCKQKKVFFNRFCYIIQENNILFYQISRNNDNINIFKVYKKHFMSSMSIILKRIELALNINLKALECLKEIFLMYIGIYVYIYNILKFLIF